MNVESLKISLGGQLTETEVVKETVRKMNMDDLISILPSRVLQIYQDRPKVVTIKFEAI